jgi:hypothetical protein
MGFRTEIEEHIVRQFCAALVETGTTANQTHACLSIRSVFGAGQLRRFHTRRPQALPARIRILHAGDVVIPFDWP